MSAALFETAGISNETDEWYTPAWFFQALGVYFDLDPCSPGVPPSSVTAKCHMTKDDNGLAAEWRGSVWLNPPFSSKREWYDRLIRELSIGNVSGGIALMPNRTETHDLQTYLQAADALLFLRGRICFERGSRPGANANGATTTPPFGIVLCAYGEAIADAMLNSRLLGVRAKVVSK